MGHRCRHPADLFRAWRGVLHAHGGTDGGTRGRIVRRFMSADRYGVGRRRNGVCEWELLIYIVVLKEEKGGWGAREYNYTDAKHTHTHTHTRATREVTRAVI